MAKIILFVLVLIGLVFLVSAELEFEFYRKICDDIEDPECWEKISIPDWFLNLSNQTDFNITELNQTDYNITIINGTIVLDNNIFNETDDKNKTKEDKNKTKEDDKILIISLDAKNIKKYNNENYTIVNINNLTNALIYYENGTIIGSKRIKNNKGEINLSINPNETINIIDNFILSEETEDAPIWFSYSSNTQKNISSNISDIVIITVQFNITRNCSDIGVIKFISHSGNLTYSVPYECFNKTITMELEGIEPALNSNTIIIEEVENLPSGVTTGANPPASTVSEPIYDLEVAENQSIEMTLKLKDLIDKIPILIKKTYNYLKIKVYYIGSLISPENKERGVTILAVLSLIILGLVIRYRDYFEEKYNDTKE